MMSSANMPDNQCVGCLVSVMVSLYYQPIYAYLGIQPWILPCPSSGKLPKLWTTFKAPGEADSVTCIRHCETDGETPGREVQPLPMSMNEELRKNELNGRG